MLETVAEASDLLKVFPLNEVWCMSVYPFVQYLHTDWDCIHPHRNKYLHFESILNIHYGSAEITKNKYFLFAIEVPKEVRNPVFDWAYGFSYSLVNTKWISATYYRSESNWFLWVPLYNALTQFSIKLFS